MASIQISQLTFAHDGSIENLFEDVSFRLDTDWKLGLTGRNGRGKTTLLQLLCGVYPYQGRISSPVAFDYFPFPVLDPSRSAREVVLAHAPDAQAWEVSRELSVLEVDEEALDRPFETLSPGERTSCWATLFLRPTGSC
jgi:lincosamide and streptogramin A transport system ATP-binding/permease protein